MGLSKMSSTTLKGELSNPIFEWKGLPYNILVDIYEKCCRAFMMLWIVSMSVWEGGFYFAACLVNGRTAARRFLTRAKRLFPAMLRFEMLRWERPELSKFDGDSFRVVCIPCNKFT